MLRTAAIIVLASMPGLVACSDGLTDPRNPVDQQPDDVPPVLPTAALAFVSTRNGAEHVYVANADGSEVTRVAEGWSPAWSPDGRKIAYVRAVAWGGSGIQVLDLDRPRETTPAVVGEDPAWSPDGRVVFVRGTAIYTMSHRGSRVTGRLNAADFWDDFSDVDSNGWRVPNYTVRHPTPSPDAREIAFLWWKHQSDASPCIGTVEAHGWGTPELDVLCSEPLGHGPVLSPPVWGPGGSVLAAFTGPREICVPPDENPLWYPWSCSASDASSAIFDYDLASADRRLLYTTPPGMHAGNPDWSPDGSQLLFDAYPPDGSRGVRRVFAATLDDGELRQLIPEAANPSVQAYDDYDADWSPVVR